jgi:ribosome-binding factor A
MVDTARARRLAKRIVSIVATQIQHSVKDPRLDMVTITAATVTPDLREATVFYTVYGDDDTVAAAGAGLASATGVLRSAVGHETGIKFTPTLAFKLDVVPANAHRIDELLAAARDADARVAQQAAGADFAGDAEPYKVPRAADDELGDEATDVVAEPPGEIGGGPSAAAPSHPVNNGAARPGERVP